MNGNHAPGGAAAARGHFETLDGLRGVAAFAVLFYHRRWWIAPGAVNFGYLAVDFFFILSGFVIAHAYWRRLSDGALGLGGFMRLRVERLGPLVALGATLGILAQGLAALARGAPGELPGIAAAWPLSLALLPVPWFDEPFQANSPAWSLFFEVVGNLVFAALIPLLTTRRLALLTTLAAAALAAVTLTHGSLSVGYLWDNLHWGMLRMLAPFAGGALIHRLWAEGRLPRLRVPVWLLGGVLLLVLAMVPPLGPVLTPLFQLGCVGVLFPLIVIAGAQTEPGPLLLPLARLGAELSYPVYILHMPLLVAFAAWHGEFPPHTRMVLLAEVAIITAIAFAASRFFDLPVRRALGRRRKALATA